MDAFYPLSGESSGTRAQARLRVFSYVNGESRRLSQPMSSNDILVGISNGSFLFVEAAKRCTRLTAIERSVLKTRQETEGKGFWSFYELLVVCPYCEQDIYNVRGASTKRLLASCILDPSWIISRRPFQSCAGMQRAWLVRLRSLSNGRTVTASNERTFKWNSTNNEESFFPACLFGKLPPKSGPLSPRTLPTRIKEIFATTV
ncbi:hypothetical protein HGRIS_013624 [Hohenbuehelia grisea]|uniref:Uncharacterized protein n=1 Tax=Hohenbuehelia grisea TaxID=104357 RepID=A0ABR3IW54_9AGAR